MELHAPDMAAHISSSQRIAGELRAELARKKRTAGEAAAAVGITPHTMGRRLNGDSPFNVIELSLLCRWLDVDFATLVRRAESPANDAAVAS